MFAVSVVEDVVYIREIGAGDVPSDEITLPSPVPVFSLFPGLEVSFGEGVEEIYKREILLMRMRRSIRMGVREKCLPPA